MVYISVIITDITNYNFPPGVDRHLGVNQCLRVAPKHMYIPFLCVFYFIFLLFYPVMAEKGVKMLKKKILDQQIVSKAPVCWSKYTTKK